MLTAILFILRLLNVSFPEEYEISFDVGITVNSVQDNKSYEKQLETAAKLFNQVSAQNPSVFSRLELGYSLSNVIDKILQQCV